MSPEMECLLEEMRDNPGAVSSTATAGAAAASLLEIRRLRAALRVNALRAGFNHQDVDAIITPATIGSGAN